MICLNNMYYASYRFQIDEFLLDLEAVTCFCDFFLVFFFISGDGCNYIIGTLFF